MPLVGASAFMSRVSNMPSIWATAMPPEDGGGIPHTV
jgi:hypothetical protein